MSDSQCHLVTTASSNSIAIGNSSAAAFPSGLSLQRLQVAQALAAGAAWPCWGGRAALAPRSLSGTALGCPCCASQSETPQCHCWSCSTRTWAWVSCCVLLVWCPAGRRLSCFVLYPIPHSILGEKFMEFLSASHPFFLNKAASIGC